MNHRSVLAAAFSVVLGASAVPALAADFTIDTNHTQAEFTVTHLALSQVRGQIPVASGTVTTGQDDLPAAATVTLSVKDIDTHSADRDRDLRGGDWFEVDKYPTMTFAAKKVDGTPQSFTMTGDLTFHGVTKPVTLTGKLLGKMVDARGRTHIAYSATTTIDRRDWGLKWGATTPGGSLVVAYGATINLNVEAIAK